MVDKCMEWKKECYRENDTYAYWEEKRDGLGSFQQRGGTWNVMKENQGLIRQKILEKGLNILGKQTP